MQLRAKVRVRLNGNGKSGVFFLILGPALAGGLAIAIQNSAAGLANCLVRYNTASSICRREAEALQAMQWGAAAAIVLAVVGFVLFMVGREHQVELLDDSEPGFSAYLRTEGMFYADRDKT